MSSALVSLSPPSFTEMPVTQQPAGFQNTGQGPVPVSMMNVVLVEQDLLAPLNGLGEFYIKVSGLKFILKIQN